MAYQSPAADILFSLNHVAGLADEIRSGLFGDLDVDTVVGVVEEAGRFATGVLAPLNRPGDVEGARCVDGVVSSPRGFRQAYKAWAEGGWSGVTASPEFGGMGLPHSVNFACTEIWNGASMGFALCPLLTEGAIGALSVHASPELRETYMRPMISGQWTGTMNLTEAGAGSDLNAVKTRAERAADGTYRIFGQKIFITYGEHDYTDNIVHLVLARLPDAPAGTRGISLFVVPKFLVNKDGSLGRRNDVRCPSIEHKLGIHASPTCVMVFGDEGGAVGYLVGEENKGLAAMFLMMNSARLAVGLQGVAIAERAYQQALAYARERRQGRAPHAGPGMSPIIDHPDIQRMLLTMKSSLQAARGVCHLTGISIDRSFHAKTEAERAAAAERAALLTPVAKAFSSDLGDEAASLGVQVHGGMGYIEETGAAQYLRDARIAAIYEGSNGIQAIDLVLRKLPLSGGATVKREIEGIFAIAARVKEQGGAEFGATAARLSDAARALAAATDYLIGTLGKDTTSALAGAAPYLKLFGLTLGGACLAKAALAAKTAPENEGGTSPEGRIALARFFAEKLLTAAPGLAETVQSGAAAFAAAAAALGDAA
jgi:alkylation response protein AidB-like acyl-CoA dehydrogenase